MLADDRRVRQKSGARSRGLKFLKKLPDQRIMRVTIRNARRETAFPKRGFCAHCRRRLIHVREFLSRHERETASNNDRDRQAISLVDMDMRRRYVLSIN